MLSQYGQFIGGMHSNVADSLFFLWGGPNDVFLGAATGGDAGLRRRLLRRSGTSTVSSADSPSIPARSTSSS